MLAMRSDTRFLIVERASTSATGQRAGHAEYTAHRHTDWYTGVIDYQADLGPLADWIQIDTTVDKSLRTNNNSMRLAVKWGIRAFSRQRKFKGSPI